VSDHPGVTPEQWQRIKELFGAALEQPSEQRVAFLDQACRPGESAIRAEVEGLLAQHRESDSGFQSPTVLLGPRRERDLLAPGQVVAHYTIIRELGRGGMATVYLADDLKHHRKVAIKVLHAELAATLGPERFLREIETTANLRHPHILPLFDSGAAGGFLFYVMPFVDGESLRDRLGREKQLSLDDALHIAREVADALDHAHGQGIVHRDIKPQNILLSGGHAVVTDFGIARPRDGGREQLTETGLAVGTAAYMSPEQATGQRELDGRSDVYSLGCVLYEMLAGELPYSRATPQAIMARVLTERPRPIHPIRPEIPAALDAVIAKALAMSPADRYSSAPDLADAMESAAHSSAPVRVPEKPARRDRRFVIQALSRRPLFAILALGILIGGGALFAWRNTREDSATAGAKLLAVLPFESLGDSTDAYFADGIMDEIRGRLSSVPGLQVIARASAMSYKNTTKTPQQIAEELGVRYLLTATVRWGRAAGVPRRVHISPELVQVVGGRAPTTKWQEPFDIAVTDPFQAYADVASRVAEALGVALGDSTRRALAEAPTQSASAYDAYLKGEEESQSLAASDPATLRHAATYYAQAVRLDTMFVRAWAQLSRVHSLLYLNSMPTPEEAEKARRAAERALAVGPNRAEGHLALGVYYHWVAKDNPRALAELLRGQQLAPGNADLLTATGLVEQSVGQWDSALMHYERARRLDPRSVITAGQLAIGLLLARRYPEAIAATERALALAPSNLDLIENRVMIALAQGSVAEARRIITAVPTEVDPTALTVQFAWSWDLYWILNETQQERLVQLQPDAFDGNRSVWAIVLAQTFWLQHDPSRARAYADSARVGLEAQVHDNPDEPQSHVLLGLALAYLGRKADAVREGNRGAALMPIEKDAWFGAYLQHQLARIYIAVDEPDKAVDQLEPLLKIPYYLSPGWLKVDPNFDPLRTNPRFQKLVAES
jgi:serine/threonine-protein kinase